jgi:hypothetical protein
MSTSNNILCNLSLAHLFVPATVGMVACGPNLPVPTRAGTTGFEDDEYWETNAQSSTASGPTTAHPTTGVETTVSESSTSNGDPTDDPCRGYTALATPAELEATPRDDPSLERLALEVSDSFVASEAVYQRIVSDANAIREGSPHPSGYFHPVAGWSGIEVLFTEAGYAAVTQATYDAWSCVHESYGPVEVVLAEDSDLLDERWVEVTFSKGNYFLPMLVPFYESLPEVVTARPRPFLPAEHDLCAEVRGGDTYFYLSASHSDCERGGCPALFYEGFRTSGPGDYSFLGFWSVQDAEPPRWYLDREDCRKWILLGDTWPP